MVSSANQSFPSDPVAIPWTLPLGGASGNSVAIGKVLIRPILLPLLAVYQRLPSGPEVIQRGLPSMLMPVPVDQSSIWPLGVIRPMRLPSYSANQRFPSGPEVIPTGPLPAISRGKFTTLTAPAGAASASAVRTVARAMRRREADTHGQPSPIGTTMATKSGEGGIRTLGRG